MGYALRHNDDLIAGLLRRQIEDLRGILRQLETGHPLEEAAKANLKQVEDQIRWLRKVALDN